MPRGITRLRRRPGARVSIRDWLPGLARTERPADPKGRSHGARELPQEVANPLPELASGRQFDRRSERDRTSPAIFKPTTETHARCLSGGRKAGEASEGAGPGWLWALGTPGANPLYIRRCRDPEAVPVRRPAAAYRQLRRTLCRVSEVLTASLARPGVGSGTVESNDTDELRAA